MNMTNDPTIGAPAHIVFKRFKSVFYGRAVSHRDALRHDFNAGDMRKLVHLGMVFKTGEGNTSTYRANPALFGT